MDQTTLVRIYLHGKVKRGVSLSAYNPNLKQILVYGSVLKHCFLFSGFFIEKPTSKET